MSGLICITNLMTGPSCTATGFHESTCDGLSNHGRNCTQGDDCRKLAVNPNAHDCTGCVPRPAQTGHLCRMCFDRFTEAVSISVALIVHLRSGAKPKPDVSGVRAPSKPGSRLPAGVNPRAEADTVFAALAGVAVAHAMDTDGQTPPWAPGVTPQGFSPYLELDDAQKAARDLRRWVQADLEQIVSFAGGAEQAVEFYRVVQRAQHSFELVDPVKRLRYLKCRNCTQYAIEDRPPLEFLGERVMECSNCGTPYDAQMATFDMRVIAQRKAADLPDLSADIEGQIVKMLTPRATDEVDPVCERCAPLLAGALFRKVKTVDEDCSVCGGSTGAGLYVGTMKGNAA